MLILLLLLLLLSCRLWISSDINIILVAAAVEEAGSAANASAAWLISWHCSCWAIIIAIPRMIPKLGSRSLKETLTAYTTVAIMTATAVLGKKSTRELNPSHRMTDTLAL